MKSHLEQSPPFAPAQAFVVQFGRETAVDAGRIAQRVEQRLQAISASKELLQQSFACIVVPIHPTGRQGAERGVGDVLGKMQNAVEPRLEIFQRADSFVYRWAVIEPGERSVDEGPVRSVEYVAVIDHGGDPCWPRGIIILAAGHVYSSAIEN